MTHDATFAASVVSDAFSGTAQVNKTSARKQQMRGMSSRLPRRAFDERAAQCNGVFSVRHSVTTQWRSLNASREPPLTRRFAPPSPLGDDNPPWGRGDFHYLPYEPCTCVERRTVPSPRGSGERVRVRGGSRDALHWLKSASAKSPQFTITDGNTHRFSIRNAVYAPFLALRKSACYRSRPFQRDARSPLPPEQNQGVHNCLPLDPCPGVRGGWRWPQALSCGS